ncbi:MAG: cysteine--tRNA ligase [Gammaproteobacteria bacterium]|nr:cysteine--tRNA ligase [Gammaproteobacteria bacterium]MCH2577932.1 cysteine--tRNA ligase [Pseudomonadales bacterium]MEE3143699.1 cysteine--tRNA ligase [Pseudomonadota bacterium]MBI90963.1 cysteine--tRNA ligase [Gammaproteobacteria bacterium]MEE3238717.1 cysteine--tRNA ligase [Pseudomonadota bacterium]|tara:strand:- start:2301 stop:3686 length:1386 start_codon:yes stop_codon:yes gene_type:complete
MLIYNTYTQQKEEFKPIDDGKVRIYVCGLTTYDYCHLGHARMLVAFDVIVRYLRARGFKVTYVRNITDIDDKILARAAENNELFSELTDRFIKAMHEDEQALGIFPPDQEPRATGHIDQIISMIETLIEKEFAYQAANGDVYFSVVRFPGYGKLSKKNTDDLIDGARIEIGELKKDPRDFVLWKPSKDNEIGWDSPWGYGRPGWHIECSAMSTCALGDNFDIHGGGTDLMFPHHENEIAQSEAATGTRFANVWIHNGPLRIDNEKMSKSLGNFFTVREVLKYYDAEVIRHLLVASHYRSPINYSEQSLQQSASALERFYISLEDLDISGAKYLTNSRFEKAFYQAMDDDFNTPEAFSVMFEMVKEINKHKTKDRAYANQLGALLIRLGGILGFLQNEPSKFLRSAVSIEVDFQEIERMIAAREQARADKDWKRADEIRDQLATMKVVVEDGDEGSSWRIER